MKLHQLLQYMSMNRSRYVGALASMTFSVFVILANILIDTSYSLIDIGINKAQLLNSDTGLISLNIYRTDKGTAQSMPEQSSRPRCAPGQEAKDPQSTIDYQITCVWPPGDIRPTRMVFGVINPKHINRNDISMLAKYLRNQFSKYPGVTILLWDNIEDARFYGEGRLDDFSGFDKNLRVTYVLDHAKSKEHIEFIPDKTQSKNKVKIDIK